MKNYLLSFAVLFFCGCNVCLAQTLIKTLRHGNSSITSVKFISQKNQLVSASDNGTLISWDIKAGKQNWKVDFDNGSKEKSKDNYTISDILAMEVSNDGSLIAAAYTYSRVIKGWLQKEDVEYIALLDAKDGKILKLLEGSTSRVLRMAFSSDGKTLASGSPDGNVRIWDTNTGNQTQLIERFRGISALSFVPNGTDLLIGQVGGNLFQASNQAINKASNEDSIIIWDLTSKKEKKSFSIDSKDVNDASFSPDGKLIAVVGNIPDEVSLYNSQNLQFVKSLKYPEIGAMELTFSNDGKLLAFFTSFYVTKKGFVFIWNFDKEKKAKRLDILGPKIWSICLSKNGKELAIGMDNGKILLYRL